MAGSLPEAGRGAGKDRGGRDVASCVPCGYSPGVRPADLARCSLSLAEAGQELGQGQPPLSWLGCPPGPASAALVGMFPPGPASAALVEVCPWGRPPLPWLGCPPGPASAVPVGVSPRDWPPLPWLRCAPGAGLRCPGGVSPQGWPPLPWLGYLPPGAGRRCPGWGVPPGVTARTTDI